jgi:hypothetical protein
VRVDEAPDRPPVLVLTELAENTNTSVTNLVEYLAYEAIRAYLPHRLEAEPPAIVLEHEPPLGGRRRRTPGRGDVDRVDFATWRPIIEWLGGVRRIRYGEPSWANVDPEELARLIGADASPDDRPPVPDRVGPSVAPGTSRGHDDTRRGTGRRDAYAVASALSSRASALVRRPTWRPIDSPHSLSIM